MIKYNDRTPDTIQKELSEYTKERVLDLAKYLDTWMSNEHNGKAFVRLAEDCFKDRHPPYMVARLLLGSALDWFAYGN